MTDDNGMDGPGDRVGGPSPSGYRRLHFVVSFLMLITLPRSAMALRASQQLFPHLEGHTLNNRAPNHTSPFLECIQVSPPVLSPETPTCQQTLMVHTFGWSYGKPFVSTYPRSPLCMKSFPTQPSWSQREVGQEFMRGASSW